MPDENGIFQEGEVPEADALGRQALVLFESDSEEDQTRGEELLERARQLRLSTVNAA